MKLRLDFQSPARARSRWLETRKIYKRLGVLFRRLNRFGGITPRSKMGQALAYAIDQLPHLKPCFLNGLIELDSRLAENAIRPAASQTIESRVA
ncbi:MAG: transposase [Verrucomicrobiota bacterium]